MTRTWCLAVLMMAAANSIADADPEAPAPWCELTGDVVTVTASPRPQARISVDLVSSDGRSIDLAFDPAVDVPLSRIVQMPVLPEKAWVVSAAGERTAIATSDGKGSVVLAYQVTWICNKATATETATTIGTAKLFALSAGGSGTKWSEVSDVPITITVRAKTKEKGSRTTASQAFSLPLSAASGARGLDSAIPDALRDTLSLLAEIAMERASAEGARLIKDKIERNLCDGLTIGTVFRQTSDSAQRLLPATCGQLDNLRINDLGASADGFLDALREDLIEVILPHLIDKITALNTVPSLQRLSKLSRPVVELVGDSIRRGFRADSVRLAVLTLAETVDDVKLQEIARIAIQCASQECSLGDIEHFVQSQLKEEARKWSPIALRLIAILRPRPNPDAGKLAGELVDILLDSAKQDCASNTKCVIAVTALRDIATGVVELDYLRALGGVQSMLHASGLGGALRGKPLALVASIASYISTYRDTKSVDAKVAHDLRKKALESLIDASTERTNRGGDWVVSLGASLGFSVGRQYLKNVGTLALETEQNLHELRLPLGISVQHLPEPGDKLGSGCFLSFSVADLAQFAAEAPNKDAPSTQRKITWSDLVAPELQAGFRFGSVRTPVVVGIDAYYLPRITLSAAGLEITTSAFRIGGFIGINVPFLDLN